MTPPDSRPVSRGSLEIGRAHDNYMRGNIDATTRDYLIEKASREHADPRPAPEREGMLGREGGGDLAKQAHEALRGMDRSHTPEMFARYFATLDAFIATAVESFAENERLRAEKDGLHERASILVDVLLRAGFVRCDAAACNCGSWHHRYGLRGEVPNLGMRDNGDGSISVLLDEWEYARVNYNHRYTCNSFRRALAEAIAAHIEGRPHEEAQHGEAGENRRDAAWVVIDENGYPTFTVGWKEGAHEHIKDSIDAGNDEAAKWVVRQYVPVQGVRNV